MIKNLQNLCFLILFFSNASVCQAQFFSPKNYPNNYFAYPVMATRSLSANFGELRPNHYHMGLDCRTDKAQNKKILAAGDGYVSKVKIEPWGYGRAIYINHPNGLTTLYAHLNDFYPELENYIKEQQYALKSWAVYLDIPKNLFPVKKEMLIAYSGNTGGSLGPHLHFEIRDTQTDKVLNPSLFNFPIPDNIAPDVFRLAVYDRCISTYEQTPKLYTLKKVKGVYVTTPALIIANTDKVSFGITASDRYTGSENHNGIYEAVLYDQEKPAIGFQLDSIGYDETRYVNAHVDYAFKNKKGSYIQHLSKLPGFNNSLYKTNNNSNGVINIDDELVHPIKIEVRDANGNRSVIQFDIKQNSKVTETKPADSTTYFQNQPFYPGYINTFENNQISFYLPENSLYDSIRFQFRETATTGFSIFQLHHTGVPLHSYFPISIKAQSDFPGKMIMHRFANEKNDYTKAEPVTYGKDTGWYRASFREFGSFQLMIDTAPPVITPVGFKDGMDCSKQKRIVFSIKDNAEDLGSFSATLDNNWLCFSNDKGRRFIYVFDEKCPAGEHLLKITATDLVGNTTERVYTFTR